MVNALGRRTRSEVRRVRPAPDVGKFAGEVSGNTGAVHFGTGDVHFFFFDSFTQA